MKRLARFGAYLLFGVVCMGIAWAFHDMHDIALLKVGVGAAALLALVDYFL